MLARRGRSRMIEELAAMSNARLSKPVRIVAACALFAVGACSAVSVEDTPPPRYSYRDGDFEYATHKGAIVTEVVGNPFGGSRQQFESRVLGYMKGQNRGKPADFVAAGGDRTLAPYKVVAAFNMPSYISPHDLCKGSASLPPPQAGAGSITLGIAFCIGDQLKSDATGRVAQLSGTDDPRLGELVRRVTEAMIPPYDGLDSGSGNTQP